MSRARCLWPVAAVLALAVILSGCGGHPVLQSGEYAAGAEFSVGLDQARLVIDAEAGGGVGSIKRMIKASFSVDSLGSQDGDSGAPVFSVNGTTGHLTIYGVAWARSSGRTFVSPYQNVEMDLGSMSAF